MIALYVFSLVLGGGFLGMSLMGSVFGGHGDLDQGMMGGDLHGGLDHDMGAGDVQAGLDHDMGAGDVHGGVDHDTGGGHADHPVADHHGTVAAKIFSVRTITYSLFGFGAVGTLLTWLWAGGSPLTTAALAVGTGVASGSFINLAFAWMRRSESGTLEGEESYEGAAGRVTLPIAGSWGLVLVEKAGREVELRALPHASALDRGDPAKWKSVVVVEMEHGIARVAPLDNEQLLNP